MSDDKRSEIPELDALRHSLRTAAGPGRTRPARWRAAVIAMAVVAAVIGLGLVLSSRNGVDRVFTVEEAAAAVAKAAFEMPGAHPESYLYVKGREKLVASNAYEYESAQLQWSLIEARVRETWSRPASSTWTRSVNDASQYLSQNDERTAKNAELQSKRDWERHNPGKTAPKPTLSGQSKRHTNVCRIDAKVVKFYDDLGALFPFDPEKLPSDPKATYIFLYKQTSDFGRRVNRSGWVWDTIVWGMKSGAASLSASQRAALVGALAQVDGVSTFGKTPDPSGRMAYGFKLVDRQNTKRVYFDPETALVTYYDVVVSSEGERRRSVQKLPVGTTVQQWELLNYEYVSRPPSMRETNSQSLQDLIMCPRAADTKRGHYLRAR